LQNQLLLQIQQHIKYDIITNPACVWTCDQNDIHVFRYIGVHICIFC